MNNVEAKVEELKAATRAANEVLADVKATLREVRKIGEEVDHKVNAALRSIERQIEEKVGSELAELGATTKRQMEISVDKVSAEFQKLQDILLGENEEREGRTIPELIKDLPDHPKGGKQYPGRKS